ncbi:MAG: hypothetical protein ABSF54_10100, partial [Bryobacteraceae bacterium]
MARPIFSNAACSHAGGAPRYSSRITGALCVCDAATSRHEIPLDRLAASRKWASDPGPKLRPRSRVTSASRRDAPSGPASNTSTRAYSGSSVPVAGWRRSSKPHICSPAGGVISTRATPARNAAPQIPCAATARMVAAPT